MSQVKGKVAIVTGAGQGLGAEISRTLASNGAKVLLCDINTENCENVATEIGEAAAVCQLNVTDAGQWAEAVLACEQTLGTPSILVNNAGIVVYSPFEEHAETDYDKVMAVNVKGPFLGMQAVMASMKRLGGGAIVNIASGNGFMATPDIAPYVASKFAVRGLTRSAALEWGQYGIRVNTVCPGMINTAMTSETELELARKAFPLRRSGEPADIAKAVLFLASDQSSYATGTDLVVDGGILSGFSLN